MNHSILNRSIPLFLGLAAVLSACRMSPEPTITGPWTGTLTKDGQKIATLSGDLEYKDGTDGLVHGNLSGFEEVLTVSAPASEGPGRTGLFTATGVNVILNCTSSSSINTSAYTGTCTLTKSGQTTTGYILDLKRIY